MTIQDCYDIKNPKNFETFGRLTFKRKKILYYLHSRHQPNEHNKEGGIVMKKIMIVVMLILFAAGAAGCSQTSIDEIAAVSHSDEDMVWEDLIEFESEMTPLSGAMFLADNPTAPGTLKIEKNGARLDYSNSTDGYIMFAFTGGGAPTISAKVTGPSGIAYDYINILNNGSYEIFPLSDGNGTYRFAIGKLLPDGRWGQVMNESFEVKLVNEFAPFLRPNTIIDYRNAPNTIAKASELHAGKSNMIPKISAVYHYLVENFDYDYDLAAAITGGRKYRPVLDISLANGKGVCYDYAALMTAMLRSQGIPCRLVMGYQGTVYHAWIDAYSNETGWINNIVRFEVSGWKLMDPTYASTGGEAGMKIANDPKNYVVRFLY